MGPNLAIPIILAIGLYDCNYTKARELTVKCFCRIFARVYLDDDDGVHDVDDDDDYDDDDDKLWANWSKATQCQLNSGSLYLSLKPQSRLHQPYLNLSSA